MIPEDASVPGQGRQSKVNRTASTFTHRHPSAGDGDGGPSDGGLSQLASFHKKKQQQQQQITKKNTYQSPIGETYTETDDPTGAPARSSLDD